MAKTILLTGATGFLGSHLLEAFLNEGYHVAVLKRSTSDPWRITHLLDRVRCYDVDVEPVRGVFEDQRIEVVVHTACRYGRSGESISQVVESNLMFGLQMLDACIQFNVGSFVNTDTLLPKYLNEYSLSKKQFTEWLKLRAEKVQVINMKLEHMYGPKDDTTKFIPWVISQLAADVSEIKLTKGEQERDFIYIDDVVSAYLLVLKNSRDLPAFSEFEVGTGDPVSVRDFLETLKTAYEIKSGKSTPPLRFGALPYRDGEMMRVEVDNHSLISLGWNVRTNMNDGILKILEEMK